MATNGNIGRRAIVVPKVRYPLPLLLESGNPQDQTTLQNALLELADDVPLARDMAAALKQNGLKGLAPLLPRSGAHV